ncbi:hypothetical protein REC12_10190 [Desulfosporosinus sp. PR]|uniref:hypothetical protein n=1 Tax=Candidatus Desulfosporosinus nitrosoreducens TaxID=3401928 RepID=UPI0027F0808C|nr:hypothetical protein [Desulfosporosinus sp. PR]MDQ7093959.1 hypothetical protein [Desulfosporosinus sp. PR]
MRHSRYAWILGLAIVCLVTIVTFQTPQTVITTMSDPHYQKSSRTTIQHFFSLLDLRQTDLARDLLVLPEGSLDDQEFKTWETTLNKDPLLSLQKVEFLNFDPANTQGIIVRVSWSSPLENVQQVTYSISLKPTEKGWRIQQLKKINYPAAPS